MSEYKAKRAAEEWAEGRADDTPAYEPTYRDGSAQNECWASGAWGKTPRADREDD